MKLIFNCGSCKKENVFKPKFSDRGLLQQELGDEVKVNCLKCGKIENKHINRIEAVADRQIIYISIIVAVVLSIVLLLYVGLIASAVLLLPFSAWLYENNSASTFNKYKIRRKQNGIIKRTNSTTYR